MERFFEKWGRFVGRWAILVVVAWIVVVIVALRFAPSLDDVAAHQDVHSLPATAPSVQADQVYATKFAAGQQQAHEETDLIVLTDPQGISNNDVSLAERIETWLTAPATRPMQLFAVFGPNAQIPPLAFESSDHQALRISLTWTTKNNSALGDSLDKINQYLANQSIASGGTLGLFGSTPINHDVSSSAFSSLGGVGLLLGLLIILAVLSAVYRSPLAVLLPLITIAMAFGLAIPVTAWLGQIFGLPVASFTLEYVGFVLLGAGTNYGVFMLSRYREEIRRSTQDNRAGRLAALTRGFARVAEAIVSSAGTVIVAMAIMGLAQLDLVRLIGPSIAVGVCCLLLAGLTLLPALMALCDKALFWPVIPRPDTLSTTGVTKGIWARAGQLVTTRPRLVTLITVLILSPLAISVLTIVPSFDSLHILPAEAPSAQAFTAYQQHFNDTAQAQIIINDPGHDLRQAQYSGPLARIATALGKVPHVTHIEAPSLPSQPGAPPTQFYATDGSAAMITLLLDIDPSSQEAPPVVDALSATATQAEQGTTLSSAAVLINGESASVRDEGVQLRSDFILVIGLVSLAIYIILALLVRSVIAPIYLLGTIALSAGTAIGLTNVVFHDLLGKPLFYVVPIIAFVFLVALGEDFNILTMARIREEVQRWGERRGIATAIALTGGVVSSCGLVMAASFVRLSLSSLVLFGELGFSIITGVLIDTFVVRPLLVPALAMLLGRWNWLWFGGSSLRHIEIDVSLNSKPSDLDEELVGSSKT